MDSENHNLLAIIFYHYGVSRVEDFVCTLRAKKQERCNN